MKPIAKIALAVLALGFLALIVTYFYKQRVRSKNISKDSNPANNSDDIRRPNNILVVGASTFASTSTGAAISKLVASGYKIELLAESGKNTSWMLGEMKKRTTKYDYIVFNGGLNDLYGGVSVQKLKTNLSEVRTEALKMGAKLVMVTMQPSSGYSRWTSAIGSATQDVNTFIRGMQGVTVIDYYSIVGGGGVSLLPKYDSGDHLHGNSLAQLELFNKLQAVVPKNAY